MRKVLMHKNREVAVVETEGGRITGLSEILDARHMPVGTYARSFSLSFCSVYLQAWQRGRAVPEDRLNLAQVIQSAGKDMYQLGELSHGMALTDCYWLRSPGENLGWEEINFYANSFAPSMLTLSGSGSLTATPDYETNGCLPKSWWVLDDIPVLMKDAPAWLKTASANEVAASRIADCCGIGHAVYFPVAFGERHYCASVNFIESDKSEFVPFQAFKRIHRGQDLRVAEEMGLGRDFIDTMTAFDLLLGNTDRHEGNFGMLMDPDTMEFTAPAPLFDSGTCLHGTTMGDHFKPFYENQAQAIKSIRSAPFELPSADVARGIIAEAYEEFGLAGYAEAAADEACARLSLLDERQMQRECQEEDLCL